MSPHQKIITMKDVAERCGVNRSTVQRALSGGAEINLETAERIKTVAAEMGYNPAHHEAARRLIMRRYNKQPLSQTIAVYFPLCELHGPYFHRLFVGIAEAMLAAHFDILAVSFSDGLPARLPAGIMRGEVDGAIFLMSPEYIPQIIHRFRRETPFGKRPLVTIIEPSSECMVARVDDFHGAYLAATHLLALGHRHVLHWHPRGQAGQDGSQLGGVNDARRRGYEQAYADAGLDAARYLRAAPIEHLEVTDAPHLADFVIGVLRTYPDCTALLAPNDYVATLFAEGFQERGFRIPEDLSVVGFDDTHPLLNAQRDNILTTIHSPLEEVGREAVRLIVQQITGKAPREQQVVLPVSLVVRQSTIPPRRHALPGLQ